MAGSIDHVLPPAVVHKEFEAYEKGNSAPVVEYHIFEGRSHGIVNQDGWKEIADFALAFAAKHTAVTST